MKSESQRIVADLKRRKRISRLRIRRMTRPAYNRLEKTLLGVAYLGMLYIVAQIVAWSLS